MVKNQVDILQEYANRGIVSREYMIPVIDMVNRLVESYLNSVSLDYDLILSRMRYHHVMLRMVNDITPKLMKTYLESIEPFKTFLFYYKPTAE